MYGSVDIQFGVILMEMVNSVIGGNVFFCLKLVDDYLCLGKISVFGYCSGYDFVDCSWYNGVIVVGGDEFLCGILVYSCCDGQEIENNSGIVDVYLVNWYFDVFLVFGIWQFNDEYKLISIFDYYYKINYIYYDIWDFSGNSIIGIVNQISQIWCWGLSLKDDWMLMNDYFDSVFIKIYYQYIEVYDWIYMLDSVICRMQMVNFNYDIDIWGLQVVLVKILGCYDLSVGFNVSISKIQWLFSQLLIFSVYSEIMQLEVDSCSYIFGGFVQDKINFDFDSYNFVVIFGVCVVY